ncbi:MAG: hypothetical protein IPK56_11215 [Elusimicrobia bacterium]|nr:hypothetical protein [Elusimicrobiota bacterium]
MTNLGLIRALEALGLPGRSDPRGRQARLAGHGEKRRPGGGEPSGHVIFREFLPTGMGFDGAPGFGGAGRNGSVFFGADVAGGGVPQALVNVTVKERVPLEKDPRFSGRRGRD